MRFRKSAHAVYNVQYHIVWTPRYRHKVLVKGVKEYLERMLRKLEGMDDDIEVENVKVQVDHVHIIVVIPPRVSVADVVKYMKSATGRQLNKRFRFIKDSLRGDEGIWSRGYCVSTIGLMRG